VRTIRDDLTRAPAILNDDNTKSKMRNEKPKNNMYKSTQSKMLRPPQRLAMLNERE
jgi:hypothetical protein